MRRLVVRNAAQDAAEPCGGDGQKPTRRPTERRARSPIVELDQLLAGGHDAAVLDQDPAHDAAFEMLDRLAAAVGGDHRRGDGGASERGRRGPAPRPAKKDRPMAVPASRGMRSDVRGPGRVIVLILDGLIQAARAGRIRAGSTISRGPKRLILPSSSTSTRSARCRACGRCVIRMTVAPACLSRASVEVSAASPDPSR